MTEEPRSGSSRESPDLVLSLRPDPARSMRGQLRDGIREAIREGRLAPGARLPSSRALAADFGISRGVVVDVYAQLIAEGYLASQTGSGTHVAATFQVPRAEPVPLETPSPAPAEVVEFELRGPWPDTILFPRRKWVSATRDAVRDLTDREMCDPEPAGSGVLRRELASYLGRVRGAAVTPATLVVVAGVTQGVALLGRLLAQQGHDALAVEDPGSQRQSRLGAASGLRLVPVPVDREGIDVGALAASEVRAVLCAPAHQYPTGAVLSAQRRHALVRWAMECDGLIIEDDSAGFFRWDRMPMACLQGLAPQRVALLGSVSRTLAPGLRIGWAIPPAPLLAGLVAAKHAADGGTPVIEQHTLARLIEMGAFDRHLRRARKLYMARRDALVQAITAQLPGWSIGGTVAGLHVWLQPAGDVDPFALVDAAKERGLGIQATSTTSEAGDRVLGVAMSYARLDADHAAEAVGRFAAALSAVVGSDPRR